MQSSLLLSQAPEFKSFIVTQIQTSSATKIRLLSLGLNVGNTITILRNRKGDTVLRNGHNRISLGQSIGQKIRINPLAKDAS